MVFRSAPCGDRDHGGGVDADMVVNRLRRLAGVHRGVSERRATWCGMCRINRRRDEAEDYRKTHGWETTRDNNMNPVDICPECREKPKEGE